MDRTQTPFEMMVEHYCANILPECIPHMDEEGRVVDTKGRPLKEGGKKENPYYTGALVVYDGPILLQSASKMVVRPKRAFKEETTIRGREEFLKYFGAENDEGEADCVYFYNTEKGLVIKVTGELKNSHKDVNLDDILETDMPHDFVTHDRSIPAHEVGTKTGIAIMVPKMYDGVRTIILKRTPYDFGMGKIAHFDRYGLAEEFFLKYDPNSNGPFIDKEHGIVGVYRNYRDENGMHVRDENGVMAVYSEMTVGHDLRDAHGNRAGSHVQKTHPVYHHAAEPIHPPI